MELTLIKKLVPALAAAKAELRRVNEAEPALRKELATLAAALAALPLDQLTNPDKGTAAKVSAEQEAKRKLELLPGLRGRCQAEVDRVAGELRAACVAARSEAQVHSFHRVAALEQRLQAGLLPLCGGDAARTETAAKAVVMQSQARVWNDRWCAIQPQSITAGMAESMLGELEAYATAAKAEDAAKLTI